MSTRAEDILHAPVGKTLRQMTLPMVFGLLSIMLFQAVDTYFIGKLGTSALAAISFTFPVTFTITSVGIGLSIGLSVLLAQSIGEGNHNKSAHITSDGLFLSLAIVATLCALCWLLITPIFTAMGATQNTLPLIQDYMGIWCLGGLFLAMPMIGNATIRATGDTLWPSIIMVLSGLINAVLDPVLIFGWSIIPALGIKGAAYASLISWVVATAVCVYLLRVRDQLLLFCLSSWSVLKPFWQAMIKISIPLCIANVLTPIGGMIFTRLAAQHGEQAVAAIGSGSKIESILMIVVFSLTAILSPFIAQNIGAKKYERVHEAMRTSLIFSVVFQGVIYVLAVLGSPWLARIYSHDAQVIELTQQYLHIASSGMVFYSVLIVMNTLFNSARQSKKSLILSAVRVFLGLLPFCLIGSWLYGYTGILIGSVIANFGVAVLAYVSGMRFLREVFPSHG